MCFKTNLANCLSFTPSTKRSYTFKHKSCTKKNAYGLPLQLELVLKLLLGNYTFDVDRNKQALLRTSDIQHSRTRPFPPTLSIDCFLQVQRF